MSCQSFIKIMFNGKTSVHSSKRLVPNTTKWGLSQLCKLKRNLKKNLDRNFHQSTFCFPHPSHPLYHTDEDSYLQTWHTFLSKVTNTSTLMSTHWHDSSFNIHCNSTQSDPECHFHQKLLSSNQSSPHKKQP